MNQHQVVIVPGDGIGPEVTEAVRRILEATHAPIAWVECRAGLGALEYGQDVLPQETLDTIRKHGVALKGPCTTPIGEGFVSINVSLRKSLDLYAVRPIRNLEGVPTRFSGVDLVIIRENTEGLYSGIEAEITSGVVTSTKVTTEGACTRIARWAFRYARQRRRTKVTVFHKANIMKLTDGMFIRCARAVHDGEFPEIDYQEMIIDAGCMALVRDPTRFDVLLLQNLYGDVVSDLCAGLVGGLGVVPGANIGDSAAIFEAVHGSAPDIAGRDVDNPLALLMSAMMLLNHLAETREDPACAAAAQRIKDGYNRALAEGRKTRDLSGSLGTRRFSDAVIDRLSS